jgi:hypothetical protein
MHYVLVMNKFLNTQSELCFVYDVYDIIFVHKSYIIEISIHTILFMFQCPLGTSTTPSVQNLAVGWL